ncbi:MAG: signal peptidase II [Acidobacteriota bacterium]
MRVLALWIAAGVFALDMLTKWWVSNIAWLHYRAYTVIDGLFKIQYVRNEGIAFGLFHDFDSQWKPWVLSLIAVIGISLVSYYLAHTPKDDRITLFALGLLLGGILGNFSDRLIHHSVVDFLTLHWQNRFFWPTFNLADAAISTGVFLILFKTFFLDGRRSHSHSVPGLLLLPVLLQAPGSIPPDTSPVVARLQSTYDHISSFRARFEQTFRSRGISETESGIVMMKRPGRMYWEYQVPVTKYFVADGRKTYFYVPKDGQLLVSDLDLENEQSPLLFLLGRVNIERDYLVSREQDAELVDPGDIVLRLTPRKPQPDFSYVLVEVASSDSLIRRLTVVEPIGQENEYLLTDFQQNVQIPDRIFRLKVPSDVEVIEQ